MAFSASDSGFDLPTTRGQFPGSAPALAVFDGTLYCAFQANDTRHILYVTSSRDARTG